jgi:hypothetical protein
VMENQKRSYGKKEVPCDIKITGMSFLTHTHTFWDLGSVQWPLGGNESGSATSKKKNVTTAFRKNGTASCILSDGIVNLDVVTGLGQFQSLRKKKKINPNPHESTDTKDSPP